MEVEVDHLSVAGQSEEIDEELEVLEEREGIEEKEEELNSCAHENEVEEEEVDFAEESLPLLLLEEGLGLENQGDQRPRHKGVDNAFKEKESVVCKHPGKHYIFNSAMSSGPENRRLGLQWIPSRRPTAKPPPVESSSDLPSEAIDFLLLAICSAISLFRI